MGFEIAFIPAVLLTGIVYLLVAAGLLKNNIKQVYSRRTKREKFLTIGVVVMAVVLMLFVAARQGEPAVMGSYSQTVHGALLWFLNGSTDILAMAVYLVCALPVIMISAAVLDEIGHKNTRLELPFFFYVLLFAVESLFYKTLTISVTGWFLLMLSATALYCKVKMHYEGAGRAKNILSILMVLVILGIFVLEQTVPVMLFTEYAFFMCINVLAVFMMNRASVLKKKIWLTAIMICYIIVFALGILI